MAKRRGQAVVQVAAAGGPETVRQAIAQAVFPQGTLTGLADIVWAGTTAATWTLFLRTRRETRNDVLWATAGGVIAAFIGMQLGGLPGAFALRNIAFGMTIGSISYFTSRY